MFQKLRRYRWIVLGRLKIRKAIARQSGQGKVKVILGASHTQFPGWIPSDLPHFNIVNKDDWQALFRHHRADHLLAEHVFEHLTKEEVRQALQNCHAWMQPNGCLRIAVPDANHANPEYLRLTMPPIHGHLSAWNFETFSALLSECGFRPQPLEYYTHDGKLVTIAINNDNGPLTRSIQAGYAHDVIPEYSSLVIDAFRG